MCLLDTQTRLTFIGRARVTCAAATRYRFLLFGAPRISLLEINIGLLIVIAHKRIHHSGNVTISLR
jgi:hypothetical protein